MSDPIVQPTRLADQHREARELRTREIIAAATKTFGDEDKANRWLGRRTAALEGRSPMALLAEDSGAKRVEILLGRIDHGLAV